MKILLYDLETFPNISYTWGKYEQNVIDFKQEWQLASFSYKWLDEDKVTVVTRQGQKSDKQLTKTLHKVLGQADLLIAHNALSFDNKKSRAKFVEHGLKPLPPVKTIDTLRVARSQFAFNSNKLDDIAKLLKVGRKVKTGGFDLWLDCMRGDRKAWKRMAEYNKQDVLLLEQVYLKIRPYIQNHPSGAAFGCPACKGSLIKRGTRITKTRSYQRYQCGDCGAWCSALKGSLLAFPRKVA